MIKEMNMEIVVEGVESREMAQKLTQLGCDYLQRYCSQTIAGEQVHRMYLEKSYISI